MGKLSIVSTLVFVGIVGFLIYLCCRSKRKGAVVQRASEIGPVNPTPMAGVINGYHPTTGVVLGYPQAHPPQSGITSPYCSNSNYNSAYIPTSGGGGVSPYPPHSSPVNPTNTPYPLNSSGGMPMPYPQPIHAQNVQATPNYPTASAPMEMDDLPPPYHTVVGQPPK